MFNPLVKHTVRYFDNDLKMMLDRDEAWNTNGNDGKGDALWRTGLAYIAYKEQIIKEGILSCYRPFEMINKEGKKLYQAMRCSGRYKEDDVSRDQTTMSLAALKVNGDEFELKDIVDHLPYRLSRRFKMGISMKCWVKSLGGSEVYNTLYGIFQTIEFTISNLLTKLIRLILGTTKIYSQEEYLAVDDSKGFWHQDLKGEWHWLEEKGVNNSKKLWGNYKRKLYKNKFYRILDKMKYPEFAIHLTGWQIYTMRDGFWKKLLQKLLLWAADKDNLLVKLQCGKNVDYSEIENMKATRNFRWQHRWDGTCYTYELDEREAEFNDINRDVLISIYNIEKNNKK